MFDRGCPVVRRSQRYRLNYGIAVHQVNGQAAGTDAVLVTLVIPFLLNCDRCFFFRIGNRYLFGAIPAVEIRCGSDCRSFYYVISKFVDRPVFFILVLRKLCPFVLPVVCFAQRSRFNNSIFLVADNVRYRR